MYSFDFTTTAVIRPEIIDRTYFSFVKNLKEVDFKKSTLYINIDPFPEGKNTQTVIDVCKKYFGNVIYRTPPIGNFTSACNWLWDNAESDFIFHIEDDWELIEKISCSKLMSFFDNPKVLQVVLRAYPYVYDKNPLSPSIIKREFYSAVGGKLNEQLNPEIQLRGQAFGLKLGKETVVSYPNRVVVKDIGRKWIKGQPFKKPDKKSTFISWKEK